MVMKCTYLCERMLNINLYTTVLMMYMGQVRRGKDDMVIGKVCGAPGGQNPAPPPSPHKCTVF